MKTVFYTLMHFSCGSSLGFVDGRNNSETRGCGRGGAARYGAVLAAEYVRAVLGLSRSVQGGKGSLRHLPNIKLIGQQAAKLWRFFANNAISRRDLDL